MYEKQKIIEDKSENINKLIEMCCKKDVLCRPSMEQILCLPFISENIVKSKIIYQN